MYKVEPSGFSSTRLLADLIKDTEEMYTSHFGEHGVSRPHTLVDTGTGPQLVVTRRERFITFAPDGNRRLTTSSRSGPAYIWVWLFLPWRVGCIKVRLFSILGWSLLTTDYSAFQSSTRAEIPTWGGLLVVYATIFIPVLFSIMVTINILVWTKVRINHVFIFGEYTPTSTTTQGSTPRIVGLDVKSKLDYQQYAEVRCPLAS
jgi:hypothetical protein